MSEPFLGQITLFAGNFAPRGWAFCEGQQLSIAQNSALFSILGTTYGGNGQTTFALPDLRGRAPVQQGQGPGLSRYSLGQQSGSEHVTLTAGQMPPHTHGAKLAGDAVSVSVKVANVASTAASPAGNVPAQSGTAERPAQPVNSYAAATAATGELGGVEVKGSGAINVDPAGGGQPISTVQPVLALNYIIALEGIFPPRP